MRDNILTFIAPEPPLRPFLVRWHDEDEGWKQAMVYARSDEQARELIAGFCGYNHQVYQAA